MYVCVYACVSYACMRVFLSSLQHVCMCVFACLLCACRCASGFLAACMCVYACVSYACMRLPLNSLQHVCMCVFMRVFYTRVCVLLGSLQETAPAAPGLRKRKATILGDTVNSKAIAPMALGTDVLAHEATFSQVGDDT